MSYTKRDMLRAFHAGFECRNGVDIEGDWPQKFIDLPELTRNILMGDFNAILNDIRAEKTVNKEAGQDGEKQLIATNTLAGRPKYKGHLFRDMLEELEKDKP